MTGSMLLVSTVFLLSLGHRPAFAERPASEDSQTPDEAVSPAAEQSKQLGEMASSLKSMAEMCQAMMQMEMKGRPWMIAAGVLIGTILTIALVLFIALEIQWIRHWHQRLAAERRTPPQS